MHMHFFVIANWWQIERTSSALDFLACAAAQIEFWFYFNFNFFFKLRQLIVSVVCDMFFKPVFVVKLRWTMSFPNVLIISERAQPCRYVISFEHDLVHKL